jgi:hypothetical protein
MVFSTLKTAARTIEQATQEEIRTMVVSRCEPEGHSRGDVAERHTSHRENAGYFGPSLAKASFGREESKVEANQPWPKSEGTDSKTGRGRPPR